MLLVRFSLWSFLLLALMTMTSYGQNRPQRILADEFERLGCESVMSMQDSFFVGITEQPGSTGTVVIYGNSSSMSRSSEYEAWLVGNAAFRNFPKDKLTIIRRYSDRPKVQFWIVPATADQNFEGEEWSLTLPSSTRPFIFWKTNDGGCPGNPRERYAQILAANPKAHGNIVLRGTGLEMRRAKKGLIKELVDSFGIARSKLRFYLVPENRNFGFADYELWIVP